MDELSVRGMTEVEFDEWRQSAVQAFATEQVAAGNWPADDGVELALRANAALLPDGFMTEGMLFLKGVRRDGSPVGVLWIGLNHPRGTPHCAFLYEIEVEEVHRGSGCGRALLAAAEDVVRARGLSAMELNVFSENRRAIRLYEACGYTVVTQQMRKNLAF